MMPSISTQFVSKLILLSIMLLSTLLLFHLAATVGEKFIIQEITEKKLVGLADAHTLSIFEQSLEKKTDRFSTTDFRTRHQAIAEGISSRLKLMKHTEVYDFYVDYDYYMCKAIHVSITDTVSLNSIIQICRICLCSDSAFVDYCIVISHGENIELANGYERLLLTVEAIYGSKNGVFK